MINEILIEDIPVSQASEDSKIKEIFNILEKFTEIDKIHYMHEDWNPHQFDKHGISVREEISFAGFEEKLVTYIADSGLEKIRKELLTEKNKVALGKTRVFFKLNNSGVITFVFLQEVDAVESRY